jgi:hypothetical protein
VTRPRILLLSGLLLIAVLAAVLVPVLTGHSVITGSDQPFGPQGGLSSECLPYYGGVPQTDGVIAVTNHAPQTATIERLSLGSPRRLRLIGAYIVPTTYVVMGAWRGWPPPRAAQHVPGTEWPRRHRPAGAQVRPGEKVSVVVGLALPSQVRQGGQGSSSGVTLRYRVGSQQYLWHSNVQAVLKAARSC